MMWRDRAPLPLKFISFYITVAFLLSVLSVLILHLFFLYKLLLILVVFFYAIATFKKLKNRATLIPLAEHEYVLEEGGERHIVVLSDDSIIMRRFALLRLKKADGGSVTLYFL